MNVLKQAGIGLLIIVVGTAAIIGLYQGAWWLREDSVNRTGQINNDSYQRQSALADEVTDLHTQITDLDVMLADPEVTDEEKAVVHTNRVSLVNNLCDSYGQIQILNSVSTDIVTFAAREC